MSTETPKELWNSVVADAEAKAKGHIAASGPVSFSSVLSYVQHQSCIMDDMEVVLHSVIVAEALTNLIRKGEAYLYEDGVSFNCGYRA
jgi:hypothetical protein